MCRFFALAIFFFSTIYSLTLNLPELVPVRHGHPRPPEGPRPRRGAGGGVTNPTTEHRDEVGRSEAQLGVCIAYPGLSPGPINRRLRRRGQELLLQPVQTLVRHSTRIMWVNEKSSAQFVYVRLSVWLGWPQASPREPLRCHISSLVIVET